ncbi:hypothetical protein ACTFBX_10460 [Aeromonas caviae]
MDEKRVTSLLVEDSGKIVGVLKK